MAKPLLTARRARWASQRRGRTTFTGKRLAYNAGVQKRFVVQLKNLVRRMGDKTQREIIKLFKSETATQFFTQDANISSQARILVNSLKNEFESLFNSVAPEIANNLVDASERTSSANLGKSLKEMSGGLTIKTNFGTGELKTITKASVHESTSLIKTIAKEYMGKVEQAVMRSITTGDGLKTLQPALEKYYGQSERKAKNVALDQTRKVYNQINAKRMQKVGLNKFIWLHSGGGQHPREEHEEMDGNIYDLDDPPVIDSRTGETGLPGQLPNCGCTMQPYYELDEEGENEDADADE